MSSLFDSVEEYTINVYPDSDWASTDSVSVEVSQAQAIGGGPQSGRLKMKWLDASKGLEQSFHVNGHQLSAMAKGLSAGKVLRFKFKCRRRDLEAAGLLSS